MLTKLLFEPEPESHLLTSSGRRISDGQAAFLSKLRENGNRIAAR